MGLVFAVLSLLSGQIHSQTPPAPSSPAQGTAQLPFYQGVAAYERDDFDQAIVYFTESIRRHPDIEETYLKRALAYKARMDKMLSFQIGDAEDLEKAIADDAKAIELMPRDPLPCVRRAELFVRRGDFDAALGDCAQALSLNPQFAPAYNIRGLVTLRKGDAVAALSDFDMAVRLDPQLVEAYLNRGQAWLKQNDVDRAIAEYGEAIRVAPKNPEGYRKRASLYLLKGDTARSTVDMAVVAEIEKAKGTPAPTSAVTSAGPLPAPAPAAIPAPPLTAVPFKLGDSSYVVVAALGMIPPNSKGRLTMLHHEGKGVWAFFDAQGVVGEIRVDPPFAGAIGGVRLGDTLEKVVATLREPVQPPTTTVAGNKAYLYLLDDKSKLRCDIDPVRGVQILTLVAPGFQPGGETQSAVPPPASAPKIPVPPLLWGAKRGGSGVFVSPDGWVVTAAHVVKDAAKVMVVSGGGKIPARVVKLDIPNDVALLKCDVTNVSAIPVSTSKAVRVGQRVFTVGYPNPILQGTDPKFTEGTISSLTGAGNMPKWWQISVPIQPGSSGGPLCDENGNLVGIIDAAFDSAGVVKLTGAVPQNIDYALKSEYFLSFLDDVDDRIEVWKPVSGQKPEDVVDKVRAASVMILAY